MKMARIILSTAQMDARSRFYGGYLETFILFMFHEYLYLQYQYDFVLSRYQFQSGLRRTLPVVFRKG
jgi:hypothetical protein